MPTAWVEKYRPKTVAEYDFPNSQIRDAVSEILETGELHHLILSGSPGCGKTALGVCLRNDLQIDDMDFMMLNGSDENSIDTFRDKIKGFAETWAMGKFKIVLIDEADYTSQAMQAALRNLMEAQSENCKFILTCNFPSKIIPAIQDRCQHWKFPRPDINDVTMRAAQVLQTEGVEFNLEQLDTFVKLGYPSNRKVLNLLQQHTRKNKLMNTTEETSDQDWEIEMVNLLRVGKHEQVRNLVCDKASIDDYERLYKVLGRAMWSDGAAIVHIADHEYRHYFVADPELNFAALCIKLGQLGGN